jgi:hypothetical protein
MPTTLAPTDICNVALSKIGAQSINSMTDQTNSSAIACNTNFQLAYLEVSRSSRWNCILTTAVLAAVPQVPLPGCPPPAPVTPWAPLTAYAPGVYLSYGGYIYIVMFAYTSTNNFLNDLTTGALTQTNVPANQPFFPGTGQQYPSGWANAFALPDDFQLLVSLNDNTYWDLDGAGSDDYEIMGSTLFCDECQAAIQYVQNVADTTKFDSLFVSALSFKLASMISTPLRQDGGKMETELLAGYERALRSARTKNAGEKQARRFNPIRSSLFNRARYGGSNG